jgi:hypothetical protein
VFFISTLTKGKFWFEFASTTRPLMVCAFAAKAKKRNKKYAIIFFKAVVKDAKIGIVA